MFTQHNEYQNWRFFFARWRIICYFLFARKFITFYTCVSEKVRSSVANLTLTDVAYFLVIPNAVDIGKFFYRPAERRSSRRALSIYDNIFLMGTVARFSTQKGHRYLIEACALLKDRGHRFKLLLIGSGDLKPELENLVINFQLNEYIRFIGIHESIDFLLQGLDCFVLPSLWEGMPMALLEAMACRVPVVATDISGTTEVIRNGENGLLVMPANSESLAAALSLYMNDAVLMSKMALMGLKTIEDRFTLQVGMASYLELYNK